MYNIQTFEHIRFHKKGNFQEITYLYINPNCKLKRTKVLNLAVVLSRDFLPFSLLKWRISHVMLKMIIDDSAFLSNQRKKTLPFSGSTGYFAL